MTMQQEISYPRMALSKKNLICGEWWVFSCAVAYVYMHTVPVILKLMTNVKLCTHTYVYTVRVKKKVSVSNSSYSVLL